MVIHYLVTHVENSRLMTPNYNLWIIAKVMRIDKSLLFSSLISLFTVIENKISAALTASPCDLDCILVMINLEPWKNIENRNKKKPASVNLNSYQPVEANG